MSLNARQTLESLPSEWHNDLRDEIHAMIAQDGRKVVVLDDDPTGTQTVHDVPILTTWGVKELTQELNEPGAVFYVLTNSRSLPEQEAVALAKEIAQNLKQAAEISGKRYSVVSRSDSTLRGHYPAEVDALSQTWGLQPDAYLIVPCFMEGGRLTIDDMHYVRDGEQLIPAGETPYARDASFGYQSSDLKAWVEEKSAGRIPATKVASITLNDLRQGGPERVHDRLVKLHDGQVCVVNSVTYRDLEVFVAGLLKAELAGKRYIYRTAASFVRVRAGLAERPLLSEAELLPTKNVHNGGLYVVGSYVPRSTEQLEALLTNTDLCAVELDVQSLLDSKQCQALIQQAAKQLDYALNHGQDAVLYTSRKLIRENSAQANLNIGQRVSAALVKVLKQVTVRPRYLVAKGGITSSDVATQAVGIRRAMVLGQILPGVPVWQPGLESRYPGMPFIVFPGNVGDWDSLIKIHEILKP